MHDDALLFEALEIFWRDHVSPASRICVAVSGGGDSVALFHLLAHLEKKLSIKNLGIAHVNHCLRGRESDDDERLVEAIAQKAGVPFHRKRLARRSRQNAPARGIEAWARERRYAFFAAVIKEHGYDFMATAHTADDQAETVLLRLLRGSGIRGLSGIAPVREDRVIRPLLKVNKQTLAEWLTNRKIVFREDSSNKNTDFTRNWIRHKFLPMYSEKEPRCVQLLSVVADNAFAIDRLLKPLINKWLTTHVVKMDAHFFSANKKGWDDEVVASGSIMSLLRERKVEFDRFHIESLEKNRDKIGKTFLLPAGWRYRPLKETIEFYKVEKKSRETSFSHRLTIGAITRCRRPEAVFAVERLGRKTVKAVAFSNPKDAFLDVERIRGKGPLVFRSVSPHEKFWPYGSAGYVNVNEFLKKQKLLLYERLRTGVVSLGKSGEILWIVGLRVSEKFKITPQTREVLKISYKPGRQRMYFMSRS
jgi:tRNA(Ile)-lysidine synthase